MLSKLITRGLMLGMTFLIGNVTQAQNHPEPNFKMQKIDDIQIGYGVATGDVDGDGKLDIVLADKKQFVWYRNPDWKKFVLAENITKYDNVCLAVEDINGDGKAEIAVGAQWNPGNTSNDKESGSVHYLVRPDNVTKPWKVVTLKNEPTVHRMHWVKMPDGHYQLVVLPLHGRDNKNGEGKGVRVIAYRPPADVTDASAWKMTVIADSMHMTHNFDVVKGPASTPNWLLIGGKEGVMSAWLQGGKWKTDLHLIPEMTHPTGEVRGGITSTTKGDYQGLYATIEPMHGNKVVAYKAKLNRESRKWDVTRHVLDDTYRHGHALACDDVLGIGQDQIIAGWRFPNADKKVGIKLFVPTDQSGKQWKTYLIDDNNMACEDLTVVDLDGDGKKDIIAAGRATKNLIIYWNKTEK